MPAQNLSTPFAALLSDLAGRVAQFALPLDRIFEPLVSVPWSNESIL
jgi:hypothetical protein